MAFGPYVVTCWPALAMMTSRWSQHQPEISARTNGMPWARKSARLTKPFSSLTSILGLCLGQRLVDPWAFRRVRRMLVRRRWDWVGVGPIDFRCVSLGSDVAALAPVDRDR